MEKNNYMDTLRDKIRALNMKWTGQDLKKKELIYKRNWISNNSSRKKGLKD